MIHGGARGSVEITTAELTELPDLVNILTE